MIQVKKLTSVKTVRLSAMSFLLGSVTALSGLGMGISYASNTCNTNVYNEGISGRCVKDIQILANHKLKYYSNTPTLTVDSQYGSKTAAGIEKIQSVWGLSQDGVVGPNTWGILCDYLTQPLNGQHAFTTTENNAFHDAGCKDGTHA